MIRLHLAVCAFLAIGLTLKASPLPDTTYALPLELKLGRAIKPFDEYLLGASTTRISRVTMGGGANAAVLQNDTVRSILSGSCSVAAVTEDGQEAVKTVVIRNAQSRYRGTTTDIVETGAQVKATFTDAGNLYEMKGDTLSPEVTADLSGLIRSEGGLKSGKIMDPHRAVKPGDTWPIDTAAFAATLGPPPASQRRIVTGSVTFVRVDTVNGVPAAIVHMDARAEHAFAEIEGIATDQSTVTAHIELTVPLDQRFPALRVASTTIIAAELKETGQVLHVDYEVSDDLEFHR